MDETPAAMLRVPIVNRKRVIVNFLAHPTARRKSHGGSGGTGTIQGFILQRKHRSASMLAHPNREPFFKNRRAHGKHLDLNATELGGAGQLFLDGIAFARRHGDELTDNAFFDAIAVQPRLLWGHEIILRVTAEAALPWLASNGADFACGHLDGEGIGSSPVV
jgi:hypothetical protein